MATVISNFPKNEVTKFTAVFHIQLESFRYIYRAVVVTMSVGLPELENSVILVRDRLVYTVRSIGPLRAGSIVSG